MRYSRTLRLCLLPIIIAFATTALPQQPFDLDTSFRTDIQTWYVNTVLPLEDGSILLSGEIHFTGDPIGSFRNLVKLNQDGQLDTGFPVWTPGGGKLTKWQDRYYVATSQTVRRILSNGSMDPTFIGMNLDPLFGSLQGGGYHVYPDGRILMSGAHTLYAEQYGFTGLHCLVWFTNTGHLDTTKQHRKCAGSLDFFQELPDGRFIGSLGNPPNTAAYDGQSTGSNVIRFHADGEWDPTFQSNVWWGGAFRYLPLADGRVYAAGNFRIQGIADTLHLVRFMPDGSLDPSFNNFLKFSLVELVNPIGGVVGPIYPLSDGRLIITGAFELVDGHSRKGICMVDTTGQLVLEDFDGAGCGNYDYQGFIHGSLEGITPTPDGNWYIWGAYHGYNDGTTNDNLQRMVSRLHGLSVGVEEKNPASEEWHLYPNPGAGQLTISWNVQEPMRVEVLTATGKKMIEGSGRTSPIVMETRALAPASYLVRMVGESGRAWTKYWIKE